MMDKMGEILTDTVRMQTRMTETVSSDIAELAGKEAKESRQMIVDLYLGREAQVLNQLEQQNKEESTKDVPGMTTYEGLPSNVVAALQREAEEEQPLPEWRTVLGTPQNGSGPTSPESPPMPNEWALDDS
jgi:hypothetical protein